MYFYYAQLLGDTAKGFMNLVLGQTQVTQQGLRQDEDRFRRVGEGSGIHGESDGLSPEDEMEDPDSE